MLHKNALNPIHFNIQEKKQSCLGYKIVTRMKVQTSLKEGQAKFVSKAN